MIRIALQGRTGNTFFQYAAAKWLAQQRDTAVVLDGTWLGTAEWKQALQLKRLPIEARLQRTPSWLPSRLKRTPESFQASRRQGVYIEDQTNHSYHDGLAAMPDGSLLVGFFQSPLYFPGFRATLQRHLDIRGLPMDRQSAAIAERLGRPNTISVHVRRGDYLLNPLFAACARDYYNQAIATAASMIPDAEFWVFSDDIDWCRSQFIGGNFHFVESELSRTCPFNDMRLMSMASHHIISNSSYSWWAAWLYWEPTKHVVMPDKWFAANLVAPISEKKEPAWITIPT